MSRHWRPEGDIVRIIPVIERGHDWTRPPAYSRSGSRAGSGGGRGGFWRWAIAMLLGAIGMALGGVLVSLWWNSAPAPIDMSQIHWNEVQAVPTRAPDAQDVAWEKRSAELDGTATPVSDPGVAIEPAGLPRPSGARNDRVSASFGYCHTGGGTNCVVDGDTFWINGEKVRIAGIDAPETHPPRCAYEAQLGNAATEKLHQLLNSGAVTMTSIDRNRDRYGRLLRNVQVDGQDVGSAMIAAGVAREYGSGRRPWC